MSTAPTEKDLQVEPQNIAGKKASAVSEPPQASAEQATIKIDDSSAQACYANFCRVTGTPEELIIDFALNMQPMGMPTEALVINQRVVLNYFTAKRMWAALAQSLQRHENAFGVLETNVQKRVQLPR